MMKQMLKLALEQRSQFPLSYNIQVKTIPKGANGLKSLKNVSKV